MPRSLINRMFALADMSGEPPQRVLIVGATGQLGNAIAIEFATRKGAFAVSALVKKDTLDSKDATKSKRVATLKAIGVKLVEGDVMKPERSAFQRASNHYFVCLFSPA